MGKKAFLSFALVAGSAILTACGSTPPAVAALMQDVAQACQSGNESALKADFAKEKVTRDEIDQHLGSWDSYFDKSGGAAYDWTYSGIRYVSLAAAAHDKDILPETVAMASPTAMSGVSFAPNITVIGFILVSFKQANGTQGGVTEPVGIDSDGTAKIALVETQK